MKNMKALIAIGIAASAVSACAGLTVREPSARAVAEKRFAAVARHESDAIAALYAPDAVEISPGFCANRVGVEGARRTYAELFRMFPTITDEVVEYVVEGDHVAVQFIARVRKADGSAAFEVPIANFLTIEHGLITRDVTYFDTKGRPCT